MFHIHFIVHEEHIFFSKQVTFKPMVFQNWRLTRLTSLGELPNHFTFPLAKLISVIEWLTGLHILERLLLKAMKAPVRLFHPKLPSLCLISISITKNMRSSSMFIFLSHIIPLLNRLPIWTGSYQRISILLLAMTKSSQCTTSALLEPCLQLPPSFFFPQRLQV